MFPVKLLILAAEILLPLLASCSTLTQSNRLRSQSSTCPSIEADSSVLKALLETRVDTGVRWPNRYCLLVMSTVSEVGLLTVQTPIVASTPPVIIVLLSAKMMVLIGPTCVPSYSDNIFPLSEVE